MSLNGKIATSDGSVSWLEELPNPEKLDYGYEEFYESIDTTIQGRATYEQIMSWGIPFPYAEKKSYVFTTKPIVRNTQHVEFINTNHADFVRQLKQQEGGDIRGKQSAALIVVAAEETSSPWNDRLIDLRVDDNENPVLEIERLLKVFRAYEHMNQGDLYVEKNEMTKAVEEYNAAMEMFPRNLEMQYWTAITLANDKQIVKASTMLQRIYNQDSNWRELTRRLPKVGLLIVSEKDMKELLR